MGSEQHYHDLSDKKKDDEVVQDGKPKDEQNDEQEEGIADRSTRSRQMDKKTEQQDDEQDYGDLSDIGVANVLKLVLLIEATRLLGY